jgi:hypothetical protein
MNLNLIFYIYKNDNAPKNNMSRYFSIFLIIELIFLVHAKANVEGIIQYNTCPSPQKLSINNNIDGTLYVACGTNEGSIISFGPTFGDVQYLTSPHNCLNPTSVVADNEGIVYATCAGVAPHNDPTGVIKIDGGNTAHLTNWTQCPYAISVSLPVDVNVYVACYGFSTDESSILKITSTDITTVTALTNATQCPNPTSVAVDTNTGVIYASCGNGTTGGIISIANDVIKVLVSKSDCGGDNGLFVDSNTGYVYATCTTGTVASVIRIVHDGPIQTLLTSSQCNNPTGIFVDTVNNIIYAACGASGAIKFANGAVTTLITPDQCPYLSDIAVDTDRGYLYAGCRCYTSSCWTVIINTSV